MTDSVPIQNSDLASVKEDMADLKASVRQIAEAVTKLAVLEDRQQHQMILVEKTLNRLGEMEDKQHAIELRLASSQLSHERLINVERSMNDIATKLAAYEMAGKVAGKTSLLGLKGLWAVFGGAVTGFVAWVLSGGHQHIAQAAK
jgi:uncharacterized coiled-coil DUF342 family protein